jgi:site-specific recombinase XerD
MPRKTFKKVIVTDELLKQVSAENLKLVEQFLKEKSTRASDVTIKNYRSDANIFFVWNLEYNENKFFVDIRKLEFADFFSFTTNELKWGSARNNRMRSFLSSLSIFIEKFMDDKYPNFRNIILKTIDSVPKEARREKTVLSNKQVENLLSYLLETDKQKACFIALAVYSGARFSELLRFTTDLIDENHTAFEGIFLETTRQIRTKGRGKTGKLLHKYILKDKFMPYYSAWLEERKSIMEKTKREHDNLFIRPDGLPASAGTVRSWISSIDRYLGVNFYIHSCRHFLCTELTRKKIPQAFIQFLFGWSSAEMYSIYNDLTAKDQTWDELRVLKNELEG